MQIDFRDVYGSILQDWFDISATTVKNLLYEGYSHLPIITGCNLTTTEESYPTDLLVDCYPNPFHKQTALYFTLKVSTFVHASVYDARGALLQNLVDKTLNPGQHHLGINLMGYSSGNYFLQLKVGHLVKTIKPYQKIRVIKGRTNVYPLESITPRPIVSTITLT